MSTEDNDEFMNGLAVIYSNLYVALTEGGATDVSVTNSQRGSGPLDTTFTARIGKRTLKHKFTVEEIQDSAQTIDPTAAAKIRVLANRFKSHQG